MSFNSNLVYHVLHINYQKKKRKQLNSDIRIYIDYKSVKS